MTVLAEAEVLIRPVTQQFATQLDKQVQASVSQINKKAIISPKVDDKGQVAKFTGTLGKLDQGLIGISRSTPIATERTSKFGGVLGKLDQGLKNVGKAGPIAETAIGRLGSGVSKLSQLFGGAISPVGALSIAVSALAVKGVHDFLSLADSVRQFQNITGATAKQSSELVSVANNIGVSAQTVGTGFFVLEKNLDKVTPKLATLGIQVVRDSKGNLDFAATFLNVADAVTATQDPAKRAEIAFTAFARGGRQLLPILEQGRAGIQALFEEAGKHGEILSQQQIDNAFKFKVELHQLGQEAGKFGRDIGSALVPALSSLAHGLDVILQKADALGGFLDRNFFQPIEKGAGVFERDVVDPLAKGLDKILGIQFHPNLGIQPQDQQKIIAVNQEMDALAHSTNLTSAQIDKLAQDLADAGFPAEQAAHLIGTVTQASADLGTQAIKTVNQINRLGTGITHAFGDTKHQVLEWQKGVNASLNFVQGDLANLAGAAKLSAKDVVKSFDDQLKAEGELTKNFDTLLKRNLPADFIKQLADMGAQGAPLVSALASANKTQFDKIVNDWEQAAHHSHDVSRQIRQNFIGDGPIKIPITTFVDVKQTKKTEQDFRNSVRDRLEGGIPVAASPKVTTSSVSINAQTVTINPKNLKGAMAGGFFGPGEIGIAGEGGRPELVVGGSAGTTVIPQNKLGAFGVGIDVDRIISALERLLSVQRPINVNEVANDPVATAESVAARLGLAGVR